MRLLKPKQSKIPTTQEAFDSFADSFLTRNGFPLEDKFRKLFGAYIQHSSESDDTLDEELMARRIRKQLANECAFYLIYPERRAPKEEKASDESVQDQGIQSPATGLVQKA
jgi:hypothetical protein